MKEEGHLKRAEIMYYVASIHAGNSDHHNLCLKRKLPGRRTAMYSTQFVGIFTEQFEQQLNTVMLALSFPTMLFTQKVKRCLWSNYCESGAAAQPQTKHQQQNLSQDKNVRVLTRLCCIPDSFSVICNRNTNNAECNKMSNTIKTLFCPKLFSLIKENCIN